ncbi:hypothetical protein AC579_3407 [Pseudocercospora musae]|uniref:Uncharacterized protein n=1 Tax=Pseudocercospora musae TaxID=113226 RepID=A0A139ILD0_9PEZI|nr:hypothetical protein AC579_3407 [Pseudocercospora musae]
MILDYLRVPGCSNGSSNTPKAITQRSTHATTNVIGIAAEYTVPDREAREEGLSTQDRDVQDTVLEVATMRSYMARAQRTLRTWSRPYYMPGLQRLPTLWSCRQTAPMLLCSSKRMSEMRLPLLRHAKKKDGCSEEIWLEGRHRARKERSRI